MYKARTPCAGIGSWQCHVSGAEGTRGMGGRAVRPGTLPRALCVSSGSVAFLW